MNMILLLPNMKYGLLRKLDRFSYWLIKISVLLALVSIVPTVIFFHTLFVTHQIDKVMLALFLVMIGVSFYITILKRDVEFEMRCRDNRYAAMLRLNTDVPR